MSQDNDADDWDGDAYLQVAEPQFQWGLKVLERAALVGAETVVDVGCGSGRLTRVIAEHLPNGKVIGIDPSPGMMAIARRELGDIADRVTLYEADAVTCQLAPARADVVFSNAAFHWILNPAALYANLLTWLKPGGRLIAQCGAAGNLKSIIDEMTSALKMPHFASVLAGWQDPHRFDTPEKTASDLRAAGFVDVQVASEAASTTFADRQAYWLFIEKVVLRSVLARIEPKHRRTFCLRIVNWSERQKPRFTLDYVRLNIAARKPDA